MTEVRNDRFKEGDWVAHLRAENIKVTKTHIAIDKLMPQLTPDELDQLNHWMTLEELLHHNPTPERRRELLKEFDTCPCCQTWLGHNRPCLGVRPAPRLVDAQIGDIEMPALNRGNHTMQRTGADRGQLDQLFGDVAKESIALMNLQRLRGGHDGFKLGIGEANRRRHA